MDHRANRCSDCQSARHFRQAVVVKTSTPKELGRALRAEYDALAQEKAKPAALAFSQRRALQKVEGIRLVVGGHVHLDPALEKLDHVLRYVGLE